MGASYEAKRRIHNMSSAWDRYKNYAASLICCLPT